MKYVATVRIPTVKNRHGNVVSKEYALKKLEYMKKQYNVVWYEWIAGDLVIYFKIDI